ncbi:dual specificity protein phosphatase family protein [bacterium]|nr:dual specificity protein phosphatase family protein [bacterium]
MFIKPKTFSLLLLLSLAACSSSQDLISPFPSTVEGLSIPNSHLLDSTKPSFDQKDKLVIRGMRPRKLEQVKELQSMGVETIINFRAAGSHSEDTEAEKNLLSEAGWDLNGFHHIEFPWRNIKDFTKACEMTVSALKKMRDSEGSVFVHCTVGEDRTGLLSGIYRMVFQGWNSNRAFSQEMCGHGFAESNPQKPAFVSSAVRESLTPLFFAMASEVEKKNLNSRTLDPAICQSSTFQNLSIKAKEGSLVETRTCSALQGSAL